MKTILSKNIDGSALIIFRIVFGLLIAIESFMAIFNGWIDAVLIQPQFTFNFIGFDWLQPLPGNGMYYYFGLIGFTGICIMLGFRYRFNIILFALLLSGIYFMQKDVYYNHYYLLLVISSSDDFFTCESRKIIRRKIWLYSKK